MNERDYKIVQVMEKYGGSFVKALAIACFHADIRNLLKIKKTWPEYWKQYEEMAEKQDHE